VFYRLGRECRAAFREPLQTTATIVTGVTLPFLILKPHDRRFGSPEKFEDVILFVTSLAGSRVAGQAFLAEVGETVWSKGKGGDKQ
jgi:hypothetical protein